MAGNAYVLVRSISSKIMMQENFYALYVFTVQSNGGVAAISPICQVWEGPIHPVVLK